MKLVFLGSPSPATPTLRALVDAGHEVLGVVTQPDKRRGRGSEMIATPVAQVARELSIPVWHSLDLVSCCGAELGVVVAYGKLIPQSLLDVVPMINVHFSLLPKWRGAAPVERALLAGDDETGVCIMGLEAGLDTGPIFAQSSTPVGQKSSLELLNELADLGAQLCVEVLLQSPLPTPMPQGGEATYAAKLGPHDFMLEPDVSAEILVRVVRLGRAFTYINGQRFRIHGAVLGSEVRGAPGTVTFDHGLLLHAGDGSIAVTNLQAEGSRRLDSGDWWRGARLAEPIRWGSATLNVG
jgi:methionyl-tRNA formyltransferase